MKLTLCFQNKIGNVAWLLEEGEESDFYDFLELYIRRWQLVASRIQNECHGGRKLEEVSRLRGAFSDARSLSVIPVEEVNVTSPLPIQNLSRSYFDDHWIEFHPYQW